LFSSSAGSVFRNGWQLSTAQKYHRAAVRPNLFAELPNDIIYPLGNLKFSEFLLNIADKVENARFKSKYVTK
jgi:hypothetical protein